MNTAFWGFRTRLQFSCDFDVASKLKDEILKLTAETEGLVKFRLINSKNEAELYNILLYTNTLRFRSYGYVATQIKSLNICETSIVIGSDIVPIVLVSILIPVFALIVQLEISSQMLVIGLIIYTSIILLQIGYSLLLRQEIISLARKIQKFANQQLLS